MKNLNWFQARTLARQGKGVRRDAWRRWLVFDAFSLVFNEVVDAESEPNAVRVAQSVSAGDAETPPLNLFTYAREDFLGLDWTDEPWSGGNAAPSVPPYELPAGTSGTSGTSGSARSDDWEDSFAVSRSGGSSSSSSGGGGGARPRARPNNAPAQAAVITITYQTDLVPGGNACLLANQHDSGQECLVIMTVSITGGPAGVFSLHIQLGADTKPAESGHTGYSADFLFTVPVNPGGTLTPNVIYHPTGGDVTQNSPNFAFPASCKIVVFESNGGAGLMSSQASATPAALNANGYTRAGYTFAGWNTSADGSGTAYADAATYAFAADATFHAQWSLEPHYVTFDPNDGTGSMSPQSSAAPAALNANTFTRGGYTFAAWNTAADGSGTAYADAATYGFAADLTLYAQWNAEPRTVIFDPNEGTGSMLPQSSATPAALNANSYTRGGYTFAGWNTSADGSGISYADGAAYPFGADGTLFAQWNA